MLKEKIDSIRNFFRISKENNDEKMIADPKSEETIKWAIRFFLGRNPVSKQEINFHRNGHSDFNSIRTAFCQTNEFKKFYRKSNNHQKKYSLPLFLLPGLVNDDEIVTGDNMSFFPPSLETLTSQLCSYNQFDEPIYKKWCSEMVTNPSPHRKQWEFVWILAAMDSVGVLKEGTRALGFGTGKEPIPSLLAKYGIYVMASDAPQNMDIVQGWSSTNQHSQNVDDLFCQNIISRCDFDKYVSWRPVDMNSIPDDLTGFDVCWSACAFEHLGSIEHGLTFVKNSLDTLRSGGYAIHTTEFNLTSNTDTYESPGLSIFRKSDMDKLVEELTADGHKVWPINYHPGNSPIDELIDIPPFGLPHLKLELAEQFICTSIGILVRKRSCDLDIVQNDSLS